MEGPAKFVPESVDYPSTLVLNFENTSYFTHEGNSAAGESVK
jgi:hypothetical protein